MKKRRFVLWGMAISAIIVAVMAMCGIFEAGDAPSGTIGNDVDSVLHLMSHSDVKNNSVSDSTSDLPDLLVVSDVKSQYGDLICLKPDMTRLKMDMVYGRIPSPAKDSIIMVFAGAYTGKYPKKGHANVAGDHVGGGKRYNGYRCERNTGAFTWSAATGYHFYYDNYSDALNEAAANGGMGFAQEMMIHNGEKMKTVRESSNENVFRALCLDAEGELAIYESQCKVTFGNFIEALLSQGVKEALYTDMGYGWNYCFYRENVADSTPKFLHAKSNPNASNFVVISIR